VRNPGFDTNGIDDDGRVTWQRALDFVDNLNNELVDCDQTNLHWKPARLPNVKELQSLIHYGFLEPAVPNTAGTGQWIEGDPFNYVQLFRNSESFWF